ncbi:MAG: ATP-grasp domain-containing protein [Dehalococcoidia bacterium]
MKHPQHAFVIGDMDLVAPLGLAGIDCVAVAGASEPTRWSRYVCRSIDELDSWADNEAMADRLVEEAEREATPPVLFYQSDPSELMVSRYRERLGTSMRFVIPDETLVEDLVDKSRFAELAARTGLDVPITVTLTAGTPLPPEHELPFPLVVKPSLRRSEAWKPAAGRAKAIEVDTYAELVELWRDFDRAGVDIVAQEIVPGPETAIESYHVYVDESGAIAGEFTGRKIRTRPADFGISTAVEVVELPDVLRAGRDVIERIGLTGVAKLDFKRRPNGTLALLEINARFSLWHYPGAVAGVNLPALVYADLTGEPRPAVKPVRRAVRWVKPWHDAMAARAAGMSLAAWVRFVGTAETRSAVTLRDPMVILGAAFYGVRLALGAE